jgi:D-tyrosyl-tRNA(Tyr) deacylase
VNQEVVGGINHGILVFLGVQKNDNENAAETLLNKIFKYRIFADEQQKMNLSVGDIAGDVLIVSQFTLAADTQKGLRPSFSSAAEPQLAQLLYNYFIRKAQAASKQNDVTIATGVFGADMQVSLVNDGPVTFLLES